jgi:hypothetical protein
MGSLELPVYFTELVSLLQTPFPNCVARAFIMGPKVSLAESFRKYLDAVAPMSQTEGCIGVE